jgi:uncharacterized membrane protein
MINSFLSVKFIQHFLIVILFLFTSSGRILAQSEKNPQEIIKKQYEVANSLYKNGKYEKAVSLLIEVYESMKLPVILQNISRCYEKLGDIPKAIEYLEKYSKEDIGDEKKQQTFRKISELKEANSGYLFVKTNTEKATLVIDNEPEMSLPMKEPVKLFKGKYSIKISAAGFENEKSEIEIRAGSTTNIDLMMKPVPPPAVEKPSEVIAPVKTEPHQAIPEETPKKIQITSSEAFSKEDEIKLWTYITGGSAAGFLAMGITFNLIYNGKMSEINPSNYDIDEARSKESSAMTFRTLSITSYVLSAISGGAAVILFFNLLQNSGNKDNTVQPVILPEGAGMVLKF